MNDQKIEREEMKRCCFNCKTWDYEGKRTLLGKHTSECNWLKNNKIPETITIEIEKVYMEMDDDWGETCQCFEPKESLLSLIVGE